MGEEGMKSNRYSELGMGKGKRGELKKGKKNKNKEECLKTRRVGVLIQSRLQKCASNGY